MINEIYPFIHSIANNQLNKYPQIDLDTTDIVHEAFIKLQNQNLINWKNRNQFYAISAQIIRRLLIDNLRTKNSQKRGELQVNITIDKISSLIVGEVDVNFDLIEFDNLLTKLNTLDSQAAKIVELRFFSGLTQKETAEVCNLTLSTVVTNWNFARSWFLSQLSP